MLITLAPEVLRWARERARLQPSDLARKLRVDVDRVGAWEETGRIRLRKVEDLAKATRVPFGYLFLREPPDEKLPVADFRTLRNSEKQSPDPDLLEVIYHAQEQQDWYRDYLLSQGARPLAFVGSCSLEMDVREVARKIGELFRWSTQARGAARGEREALEQGIRAAEECGIIVQRRGYAGNNTRRTLKVELFRGLALVDEYAPFVIINSTDAQSAQIFTLVHEVVHLWLGISAVSGAEPAGEIEQNSLHEVEKFCDSAAAEYLVPAAELMESWPGSQSAEDAAGLLARKFKVSKIVMLRRLRDLRLISRDEFWAGYDAEIDRFRQMTARKARGGGDFYATRTVQLGKPLATALLESSLEGRTSYGEALHLLGIGSVEKLRRYARRLEVLL